MFQYIIKRVLIFIPTLFAISIVVFMLSVLAPGDPVEKMLGANPEGEPIDPQAYNETRAELGLDLPVFYFSFTSKAYPDTLYKIPLKSEFKNAKRLINEFGNWESINAYLQKARELKAVVDTIPRDSLNGTALIRIKENLANLVIKHKEKDINKAFGVVEDYLNDAPSVSAIKGQYDELKSAYQNLESQETRWKLKVPTFNWYGYNNQYHRWLLGNRPLSLKKEKKAPLAYNLSASNSNTYTPEEEGYHRFKIKVDPSTVKPSGENAEILLFKTHPDNENIKKVLYREIIDGKHTVILPLQAGQTLKLAPSIGMIDLNADVDIKIDHLLEYNPTWSAGFLRFDFGISYEDKRPIAEKIGDYIFWTMTISIISLILTYLISIPIGVYSARKKGTTADAMITTVLFILYSLPSFWVATLLITFLCQPDYLNWFPPYGLGEVTEDMNSLQIFGMRAYHLILPLFCWTYGSLAFLSRQMRGGMLSVLRADYVRTARAKGLEEKKVIWKHAFRNSLLPVITLFGSIFPLMVSGSIVIEIIFTLPGMGRLLFEAIKYPDYPLVFAVVLMTSLLTMIGYLIADILYAVVDPRITFK